MSDLIISVYNDLYYIFLSEQMDLVLFNILNFIITIFSYFMYIVLIILIISIAIDLIKFMFQGGKQCKIF